MPPFNFRINPLRRAGFGIKRSVEFLDDHLDPARQRPQMPGADVNPAELDRMRAALPPSWNGTPNPATQPRAVTPGAGLIDAGSDRPAMPVNTRPRQVTQPANTPGQMVPPAQTPATRPRIADPVNAAEYDYVGQHGKRSAKEIALGALYGLGQGGLGGAIGGAVGTAIAPEQSARLRFRQFERPRLLEDQQYARNNELYGLKVQGQEAQIEKNRQQAEAAKQQGMLHNVPQGNSVITPTGREVYKSPIASRPVAPKWEWVTGPDGKPKQVNVNAPDYNPSGYQPYNKPTVERQTPASELRRQAEDDVLAEDGNPAQIEEDTWQGRKQAVLDAQLSPLEKQILYEPQKPVPKKRWDAQQGVFIESNEPPDLEEQAKVRQRVAAIEEAERRKIRSGIQGEIKRKASARVGGKSARPVMPASGGKLKPISRALVEQYAKDNGVSFEKAIEDARADGYDVR